MHGMMFMELQKYVQARHGKDTWEKLLEQSGAGIKSYLATKTYPDEEIVAIVSTASRMTNVPAATLLEDFGEFIVPDLVSLFAAHIDRNWKTLDLIEHTEAAIHTVVRRQNPGAAPPALHCTRTTPDEVVLRYSSQRKMCGVAKGIAKGLARHFNEELQITEPSCMHKGARSCTISFKRVV